MDILGLNTKCGLVLDGFKESELEWNESLLGFDSVIIDTFNFFGKKTIYDYVVICDRISNEIEILLINGKTIYILVGDAEIKFLFPHLPSLIKCKGRQFNFANNSAYGKFLTQYTNKLEYLYYFESSAGITLATIKNTDKKVAGEFSCLKGKIILLPQVFLDTDNYGGGNPYSGEEVYFNDRMYEYDFTELKMRYIKDIINLEQSFNTNKNDYQLPEWTKTYFLPSEKDLHSDIDKFEQQQKKILENIQKKKQCIANIEKYKNLFVGSGTILEITVKEVLTAIGFNIIEQKEKNRTDLIALYKDIPVVFEVKGLTKSAGEKNSAQLEKWVTEYYIEKNISPKAILLVNTFKDTPLQERTDVSFPNQMLKYAQNREHCLITTLQFLGMFLYIKKNPNEAETLINEFLNTTGIYSNFLDYTKFITLEACNDIS